MGVDFEVVGDGGRYEEWGGAAAALHAPLEGEGERDLGRVLGESVPHVAERGAGAPSELGSEGGPANVPPKLQWFCRGHHLQGREADVFLGPQRDEEAGLLEFVEDG